MLSERSIVSTFTATPEFYGARTPSLFAIPVFACFPFAASKRHECVTQLSSAVSGICPSSRGLFCSESIGNRPIFDLGGVPANRDLDAGGSLTLAASDSNTIRGTRAAGQPTTDRDRTRPLVHRPTKRATSTPPPSKNARPLSIRLERPAHQCETEPCRSTASWRRVLRTDNFSGAYRDRTGDLRLAKPALSQLS